MQPQVIVAGTAHVHACVRVRIVYGVDPDSSQGMYSGATALGLGSGKGGARRGY